MSNKLRILFGELLKDLRKSKKLSREALSERSKIHVNSIYFLEKAFNEPKLSTIIAICEGLEILPEDMIKTLSKRLNENKDHKEGHKNKIDEYYY